MTDPSGQHWWNWVLDIGIGAAVGWFAPEIDAFLAGAGGGATAGATTMTAFYEGQVIGQSTATFAWAAEGATFGGAIGAEAAAAKSSTPAKPSKTPCYPNVKKFVNDHLTDAQSIAKQIGNGVTTQEVLATSAGETTYGTSNISSHGNFFGLHGPGPYPGQTGTYLTKPAYGKGVITPEFSSNGFRLSGNEFANRESPYLSNVNASDPQTFFSTIHAHGYGTTNSDYMNNMMGYKTKAGKTVNGVYSLVGGCL